jgi:telomerase reverse transcriptase
LIPLIRSNFYVTESNVDRYRLFFFRHDVWRYVAEPAMGVLKTNMFEEVKTEDALCILQSRRLGYSQVRLLPKQNKMRPIMNLRRRTLLQGDKKVLGPSINTILGPVNSMLKLEKVRSSNVLMKASPQLTSQSRDPIRLGSSLFSVGDIYQRIKAFKAKLGPGNHKFYFAKVDVQAAFDTIPQSAMIDLLKRIPRQASYKMLKHAEVALPESASGNGAAAAESAKPIKRWHTTAKANNDTRTFPERLEESLAARKKHTVFVESAVQKAHDTRDLLALTAAHIERNLVRIGKKYYRQKAGIPQGSVLSSTLCNYFYADLERTQLSFLQHGEGEEEDCLLLRLIDDFLLITTDRGKARRFVEVMHRGVPEYGVTVNPGKSLVNFELAMRGTEVPRVEEGGKFPYCGLLIDCGTLAVTKLRDGGKGSGESDLLSILIGSERGCANGDQAVFNSLTVEYSRCPGRNFKRKILSTPPGSTPQDQKIANIFSRRLQNPIPSHVLRHVAQLAPWGAWQHLRGVCRDGEQDVGLCAVHAQPAWHGCFDR